jgi:carboxypeptidase Taq
MQEAFNRLSEKGREVYLLAHTAAILSWDQETYMPPKAVEERSEQMSYLQGLLHDVLVSDEIGKLFQELDADDGNPCGSGPHDREELSDVRRAYIRKFYRDFTHEKKLPKKLVTDLARETSVAQHRWIEARQKDDFSLFEPNLKRLLGLVREKAEKLGYGDHPYDALLDLFEPETTTARIKPVFQELKAGLKELVEGICQSAQVDNTFLHRPYPVEKQERFGRQVLRDMGYDFERGRLDLSAHPFTTTLGSDDVRLTTRYNEHFFNTGIFGSIHEGGHGLYELGFSDIIRGNILADGTSLGIHESQSRMWENLVGRSLPFWKHYFPELKRLFPDALGDVPLDAFYRGINRVEPSFIRVEADEVTYNLHIVLRFEMELELIDGSLKVENLPSAWNEKMQELLGITPKNDAEGVLQDIHWSHGAFGYFPTYTLGNLYAAQFFHAAADRLPDLTAHIEAGNLTVLLNWLRENIHAHGSMYTAEELCGKVAGEPLTPKYFLEYLREKFQSIYEMPGD